MTIELRVLAPLEQNQLLVKELSKLDALRMTRDGVWSLERILRSEQLDAIESRVGLLDYAQVAVGTQLAQFKLLVSDMDSTLITIECIDEIADFCGKKAEVAAITEATMRGEISSFEESLRRRVGILKGLTADSLQQVYDERLELSPGANELILELKRFDIKTLLVSGGFTFFSERLKDRLGLDGALANNLEIVDGVLTGSVTGAIVDGRAKAQALLENCARLNIQANQTIAAGDGSNDLPMMKEAGLSVAYHAKPVVRAVADMVINRGGLDRIPALLAL
jgi:phosphoserine phosphatase